MTFNHLRFSYGPEPDGLLRTLCLEPGSGEAEDFLSLLSALSRHCRPQAAILSAGVAFDVPAPGVMIGGELFRGRSLRSLLDGVGEVWPYVATCGLEVYNRVAAMGNPLERFWAEYILEDALAAARRGVEEFLHRRLHRGKTAVVAPGTLPEWPLEEQEPLFRLLGAAAEQCGVALSAGMTMIPNKTVSGIFFPSEEEHAGCRHCARDKCIRRVAEYDSSASRERGR